MPEPTPQDEAGRRPPDAAAAPAGEPHDAPPALDAEDAGLAVEAAGEARGFSPMVWVPVLLIVLVAIVLLFLNYS